MIDITRMRFTSFEYQSEKDYIEIPCTHQLFHNVVLLKPLDCLVHAVTSNVKGI